MDFTFVCQFSKYIVDAKNTLGGQEIDFSILFQSDKTKILQSRDSWDGGIAFTMAESGAFGNIKEVDNTNFLEMLPSVRPEKDRS
jgi:hypothetical protein